MPEHIRLLSVGRRFLTAAKSLSQHGGQGANFPVPHYLAGHAIEVALKAHLVHAGADEAALKKLGHDLERCLGRVDPSVRAVLQPEHVLAIQGINPYYAGKELEYSAWGGAGRLISVPDVTYLVDAGSQLVGHLDRIFRAEVRAQQAGRKP